MSLPAIISHASIAREPLCGEVTCLKLERQCKPFVYLNPAAARQKKSPAGPSSPYASPELAFGIWIRLLLLLPGLLLPPTLLLTRLLPKGLVLPARFLIGIAHSASPLLNMARD
jgi:hypothetical protein